MELRREYRLSIIFIFIVVILGSCYKEQLVYPDRPQNVIPQNEAFNFTMLPSQEELIYEKRGENFLITDPLPLLTLKNHDYPLDRFRIRGASTLNFRRKSYSVNLDLPLNLQLTEGNTSKDFEEFKLISLVYDYTYIEHAIATEIFRAIGLWPVHSFFTEVTINENTQGLYLFIEDPEEYFLKQENAAFILRRGYHNSVSDHKLNDDILTEPAATYLSAFQSIYDTIVQLSGKELYEKLSELMDIEQYFQKMAVDLLLRNGDTTDEVFFYMKPGESNVFGIFPWDYDDLFSAQPHEVGRNWSVGTLFGSRTYNSIGDIEAEIGDRLIYTIEDDLDYKIAIDDYLYEQYKKVLEEVMMQIDEHRIEQVITHTENTIQPFYEDQDIIEQSKYDSRSTSQEQFKSNLEKKKQFLLDRRDWIINQL